MSATKYMVNGREVSEEEFSALPGKGDELFGGGVETLPGQSSAGWPKASLSMAVHPSQAKEAFEQARRMGVPTDFTPRGEPILTSPGHQKAYARALGLQDIGTHTRTRPPERD